MTTTELRCIGDLPRVLNAFLGFVLPEFNIACDFHTLRHLLHVTYCTVLVSSHHRCDDDAITHVIGHTICSVRRTESTTLPAQKSP